MTETITTDECRNCAYGSIQQESPRMVKVYCSDKSKTYFYGQRIPCENKCKRKEEA